MSAFTRTFRIQNRVSLAITGINPVRRIRRIIARSQPRAGWKSWKLLLMPQKQPECPETLHASSRYPGPTASGVSWPFGDFLWVKITGNGSFLSQFFAFFDFSRDFDHQDESVIDQNQDTPAAKWSQAFWEVDRFKIGPIWPELWPIMRVGATNSSSDLR